MEVRSDLALHIKIVYVLMAVNTCLTGILYLTSKSNCACDDQTINIYKNYSRQLRGKTFSRVRRSYVVFENSTIDYNFCRKVMSDCDLRTPVYTGAKGQKGEPGIDGKGVKGCQGEKGDEGLPGIPGKEGDTGKKGEKGEAGLHGLPGMPGKPGPKGDIGNPGIQGPRGYPGYKGERGQKGEQGIQGELGPPGRQGNSGPKGDMGVSGPRGDRGFPGEKGDRGVDGRRGHRGQFGPKGEKGETGQKGDRGNNGVKGKRGDFGPRGETGAIGPKGESGEKGSQGESWSPSSNETCLCSCTYLGAPATSPVTLIQEKEMTTDIVACTATSTTTSTSTTTTTTTTTTTPVPTTPKPRKSYCIIKKIGIPFFKMKSLTAKGSWMRDQFANAEKMWITEGISGQFLKEFASMGNTEAIVSYNLTQFYYQGTDHIVYNGTFCYHWRDTIKIVCYDLRLRSVVMAIDVEDANYDSDRTFYKGSNSYFDLEADDNGLWLLYSKKDDWDNVYVLLFHPGTLREYRRIKVPVKAWEYGNGFISCGILYLVTSSSTQRTSITFAYDLFEMKSIPVSLNFINPYAGNSMISFYYNANPRFCRLLGWDDGKLIDYQILFQ